VGDADQEPVLDLADVAAVERARRLDAQQRVVEPRERRRDRVDLAARLGRPAA
jgi:hypothetical protein